ncbi:MAG: hypothetical protein H6831_09410 [Planctomycetes bacterium]|nr:hypothetical protein [Planctomycetota bacterium]MCB9904611.1 hypothetical protein [Planctomycetota bacterium]
MPRTPARPSGILKIAAAFLVLACAGMLLFLDPLTEVNAADEMAVHFVASELPFGFRVERAHRLMSQELVVELESDDPRAGAMPAVEVGSEDSADPGETNDPVEQELEEDRERHALEDGTPPARVFLVRYPRRNAQAVLAEQMARHGEELGMHGGDGGGDGDDEEDHEQLLTIDGGRLPWGDYDADFVLERKYTSGGHFEDVLRVNLTRGQQCWVMFALWPRDYRGSRAPVEALLDALRPV